MAMLNNQMVIFGEVLGYDICLACLLGYYNDITHPPMISNGNVPSISHDFLNNFWMKTQHHFAP